ncbi:hypothetical protein [Enterovibrio norvegicus]|uniref:hypothetical protein n=1 Tax=Enterovibrio norvegicus TaxID=188144 RepID=UPI00352CD4DD
MLLRRYKIGGSIQRILNLILVTPLKIVMAVSGVFSAIFMPLVIFQSALSGNLPIVYASIVFGSYGYLIVTSYIAIFYMRKNVLNYDEYIEVREISNSSSNVLIGLLDAVDKAFVMSFEKYHSPEVPSKLLVLISKIHKATLYNLLLQGGVCVVLAILHEMR